MYSKVTYENDMVCKQVLFHAKKFKNLDESITNERFMNLFYQDSLEFNNAAIKVPKFLYRDNNTIVQEKARGVMMQDFESKIPEDIFDLAIEFFRFANSRGHYHGDVSEENLIYDEESKTLWIIDFGFASEKEVEPEFTDIDGIMILKKSKRWM